jgi:hypothetical protein
MVEPKQDRKLRCFDVPGVEAAVKNAEELIGENQRAIDDVRSALKSMKEHEGDIPYCAMLAIGIEGRLVSVYDDLSCACDKVVSPLRSGLENARRGVQA